MVTRGYTEMDREERLRRRREQDRARRLRETAEEREARLAIRREYWLSKYFTGETAPMNTPCTVADEDAASCATSIPAS